MHFRFLWSAAKMKIFDMHIHSYAKEVNQEKLLSAMDDAGVYGGLVYSNWPRRANEQLGTSFINRLNEVLDLCRGAENRLFPILWIHPYEDSIMEKIRIACESGIAAFKIICTDFYVYEEQCMNVLREIARRGKPVIFHSGILWDGAVSSKYNRPINWEALLDIDGIRFSMGHCSWPWVDECIALYGKFLNAKAHGKNVEMYFDITPGTPEIYRRELLTKLYKIGYDVGDNVLFGTDASADSYNVEWVSDWLAKDCKIMDELGVSLENREKLYSKNVFRFLGIKDEKQSTAIPACDDSNAWSPVNPSVKSIIEKWYNKLNIPSRFNDEFYRALESIPISDAISIYRYDLSETDGKRNLLSYLFMCEELERRYKEKGIPEEILLDTLACIRQWTIVWSDRKDGLYLGSLKWLKNHLSMHLFKLGRLQFCMAESHYDIPKYGVKAGDKVMEVHIPANAGSFAPEECRRSFALAKEFFKKYYPEYDYKCFTCYSWLLDGELKHFLNENSNIIHFGNMFDVVLRNESNALLTYIFKRTTNEFNVAFEASPSSFAERIKKAVLDGHKFYECLGVIEK
jgi:predicted TIM-barrel fold metal-dependent hydrolase